MRANRRRACLGFVAALAACARSAPPSFPSPLLGRPLPRLGQATRGGNLTAEQLQGRVVVIEFFAEYCEPCERLLPELRELYEHHHPEVAFVGISLDESTRELESLVSRHRLAFPIIHDRGRILAGRFRVTELPIAFLVDARGTVRWVSGPAHTGRDIEQVLLSLL